MSDEREFLTPEQAEAMLPDGERIHTFRAAGFTMIGADWPREKLIELFRQYTPELSGPGATGMKHGLCVIDDKGPLFIETKPSS